MNKNILLKRREKALSEYKIKYRDIQTELKINREYNAIKELGSIPHWYRMIK